MFYQKLHNLLYIYTATLIHSELQCKASLFALHCPTWFCKANILPYTPNYLKIKAAVKQIFCPTWFKFLIISNPV
jgi:hypothetical protein